MGATGYLYESIKDNLKWAGIRKKFYVGIISKIGALFVLDDEAYNKERVKHTNMDTEEIANTLKAVFGG